jgi:hypothetical protein
MCLAPLTQPERPAPKGQESLAQSLPWVSRNKDFALKKGREIEPRLACRRPLFFGCFARSICRPFRARRLGTGFPGLKPRLKPRAESSRPLWGEEVSQIPLIFVPFNPGLCFLGHFGPRSENRPNSCGPCDAEYMMASRLVSSSRRKQSI